MLKNGVFYLMLCTITIVAGIDTFWTSETRDIILETEENPMSKLLIQQYGVSFFLSLKLILTTFVITVLQLCYYHLKYKRWILWAATSGLLVFQAILLLRIMSWPPFGYSWS